MKPFLLACCAWRNKEVRSSGLSGTVSPSSHDRGPGAKALPVRGRDGLEPRSPGPQSGLSPDSLGPWQATSQGSLAGTPASQTRSALNEEWGAADSTPWDYPGCGQVSNRIMRPERTVPAQGVLPHWESSATIRGSYQDPERRSDLPRVT